MSSGGALGEQPSRMQSADLGSAFGTRSEGLAGRLPARRAAVPVPAPEESTQEQRPEPSAEQEDRSLRRGRVATSGAQPIVVYVSASIRERLRAHVADQSYTELALAALDATHDRLAEKFSAPTPPTNSLFAGRGRARHRRHDEPQVQISLRPLRDDLAVIDRLQREMGAPSRSALINAAFDEHLPQLDSRPATS